MLHISPESSETPGAKSDPGFVNNVRNDPYYERRVWVLVKILE